VQSKTGYAGLGFKNAELSGISSTIAAISGWFAGLPALTPIACVRRLRDWGGEQHKTVARLQRNASLIRWPPDKLYFDWPTYCFVDRSGRRCGKESEAT
jgi:hypothetical protein